jgi:hypothetical protein
MAALKSLLVHPLVRLFFSYALFALVLLGARLYFPAMHEMMWTGTEVEPVGSEAFRGLMPEAGAELPAVQRFTQAMIAMAGAFLLMIPVIQVYTGTRHKRGYQQSMVQTLVILPVVVAAVTILVKTNIALAFSLGGIVAAVSFRNRLEDSKDSVYVFLSIAVGLAAGHSELAIAIALSVFFNAVILILFYTDFGRVPAELGGSVAQKRLDLAKGMVEPEKKKSGQFVSVLDQQVLKSMTSDQLAALADRAMERRSKMEKVEDDVPEEDRYDGVIRIACDEGQVNALRTAVEAVLENDAKAWRFDQTTPQGGGKATVDYSVRCRKKMPKPLLVEAVRRAAIPHADLVSFE